MSLVLCLTLLPSFILFDQRAICHCFFSLPSLYYSETLATMELHLLTLTIFCVLASAFPPDVLSALAAVEDLQLPNIDAALDLSKSRTNCGPTPCGGIFNAKEQYVPTTGKHAYASPAANQIRGRLLHHELRTSC